MFFFYIGHISHMLPSAFLCGTCLTAQEQPFKKAYELSVLCSVDLAVMIPGMCTYFSHIQLPLNHMWCTAKLQSGSGISFFECSDLHFADILPLPLVTCYFLQFLSISLVSHIVRFVSTRSFQRYVRLLISFCRWFSILVYISLTSSYARFAIS